LSSWSIENSSSEYHDIKLLDWNSPTPIVVYCHTKDTGYSLVICHSCFFAWNWFVRVIFATYWHSSTSKILLQN